MADDVVPATPEEIPVVAPEAGETASPDTASVSEDKAPAEKLAKTFSQEELDAAISKRLAREERKWQRERDQVLSEAAARAQPKVEPPPNAKPVPDNFKTTEDYLEALTDWKAEQKVTEALTRRDKAARESHVQREVAATVSAFSQKEDQAREKYEDYDDVVRNPKLPITEAMARTLQESDSGPELAYYLGKNPGEAARIAKLSPFLQAKELGRLEGKLPETPKKTTSAPEPLTPVNTKGGSTPVFDTTDPRSLKTMSTTEWINAERERQRKKLEAQGYR